MEEVLILRRDYDGNDYAQKNVVTLYNLDFCDEISSRIATRDQGAQVWRFEAIRQILRDQSECFQRDKEPRFFIILLTFRNQIDAQKLRTMLASNLYGDTQKYLDACGGISSLPTNGFTLGAHTWALKAYIHNFIRQYLSNPNISAVFFPLVKYMGTPVRTTKGPLLDSPMLHCMMLCRFEQIQSPNPTFLPADYLPSVTSVAIDDQGNLGWDAQPGEIETPSYPPCSADWLRDVCLNCLDMAGSASAVHLMNGPADET